MSQVTVRMTTPEFALLVERLREAGSALRDAARSDHEDSALNSEVHDRWQEFGFLVVGIFERDGLWPPRQPCRECALTIWPVELKHFDGRREACDNCLEEGADAEG